MTAASPTASSSSSSSESSAARLGGLDREIVFALVIFVVGFTLRFAAARFLAGEPVWDGHYYDFGAKRIAGGHGYSDERVLDGGITQWHPWCHYPVGYSGYLAAFYAVLGTSSWVAHFANALSGSLMAVVVFLLARTGLSRRRAHIAGVLTAIHPGLVLYGALVMGEILSALTVMFAFWVAIFFAKKWQQHSPLRAIALGAIVLGVGALVRPQALLCAPFLALVIPRSTTTPSSSLWLVRLRAAAALCVVAILPVLPWTARNCAVMDGCALVSTNAGWNLAIGSFPRATGRFETLRSTDGCSDVTGQVQQDRCWLEYGVANIKREPGRWVSLIPAKLSYTFDHESFAVEYLREARPLEWPEERRVAWRTAITSLHRVLVVLAPLAFVALILPKRKRRRAAEGEEKHQAAYRGPLLDANADANAGAEERGAIVIDSREERRARMIQGALFAVVSLAGFAAVSSSTPTFWPLVLGVCVLAFIPWPGRPPLPPALSLPIALIFTTAITHAVFFGDDRYHMVITPALCLLAAAMFRKRAVVERTASS